MRENTTVKFGYHENGSMSTCKAKPGNEGRYGCPHHSHVELTIEDLKTGIVTRTNEEVFKRELAELGADVLVARVRGGGKSRERFRKKHGLPPQEEHVPEISFEVLMDQVKEEKAQLEQVDGKVIDDFYEAFDEHLSVAYEELSLEERKVTMSEFLASGNRQVKNLLRYLGEDNLSRIGDLLAMEPNSMVVKKQPDEINKRSASLRRVLLTNLNNDMDSRNYMRSVLYFKGLCCYCDKKLGRNGDNEASPTGEHITPISPDSEKSPVSGTRYGNMALACFKCNRDRSNLPLEEHVWKSPSIPLSRKPLILARFELFREFAGYRDYNALEQRKIKYALESLNMTLKNQLEVDGRTFKKGGSREFRSELTRQLNWLSKATLVERKDIVRSYENSWPSAEQWNNFTKIPPVARGLTVRSLNRLRKNKRLSEGQ